MQSNVVKEVPEDQATMVKDVREDKVYKIEAVEGCLFSSLETGMAIVDSGAYRTIVGEEVWKK